MNLDKYVTEDGQNVQIHFQKLKAKVWTHPDMDAEMEIVQGFPEEISFEFLFFNRGYFTPTKIMK